MKPGTEFGQVIDRLRDRGQTLATAESLTGGLLCARLTDIPGASAVVAGGFVTYTHRMKTELLGVDPALLATKGAVCPEVARDMALAARTRTGVDWAVATTGVAGPEPSDGQPVGTVFIAVAGDDLSVVEMQLGGDRDQIRELTCRAASRILLGCLE